MEKLATASADGEEMFGMFLQKNTGSKNPGDDPLQMNAEGQDLMSNAAWNKRPVWGTNPGLKDSIMKDQGLMMLHSHLDRRPMDEIPEVSPQKDALMLHSHLNRRPMGEDPGVFHQENVLMDGQKLMVMNSHDHHRKPMGENPEVFRQGLKFMSCSHYHLSCVNKQAGYTRVKN